MTQQFHSWLYTWKTQNKKGQNLDSPGGPVVKNPPTNAGLILGPRRFHMLRGN